MKFAHRLVCSSCWSRVPFELKHELEHSKAFSPASQHESAAKIIAHLRDRHPASGIQDQSKDPKQLALL